MITTAQANSLSRCLIGKDLHLASMVKP